MRNRVKCLVQNAKHDFEKEIVKKKNVKHNPKRFWRYVKSKRKIKSFISELKVNIEHDVVIQVS